MLDLSVVLPALNESGNIAPLLRSLRAQFDRLNLSSEIIVVDGGSTDQTRDEAVSEGALCFLQKRPGYGGALREGFERARGEFVLTLDCDQSHSPDYFPDLWQKRAQCDIVIASRFVGGGDSQADPLRKYLSVILNKVFKSLLRVEVKDSSSGYRLYRRRVLKPASYRSENFNVLQEILVRAISDGFRACEIPLRYLPRVEGASHASIVRFGINYIGTLWRLWILRHDPRSADYEHNAFDSRHPLQRHWQRKRHETIRSLLSTAQPLVDVGCGSARRVSESPDTIALDLSREKLRFLSATNPNRLRADARRLPLADRCIAQLVLSHTLPEVSDPRALLLEANRVLVPGGQVIVCVPDEDSLAWKFVGGLYRRLPNIQTSSQATFTKHSLTDLLALTGFRTEKTRTILGAELIVLARKLEDVH